MIYFTVIFFWARNINKKKSIRLLLRAFFFPFYEKKSNRLLLQAEG